MLIVGLTGGIGSGKSFVSDAFAALGVDIVDTDVIAREVVEPGTQGLSAIKARYESKYPNVINQDGTLNRPALRAIIFDCPNEKTWIERTLHPEIKARMLDTLKTKTASRYKILSSALLIEKKQYEYVDRIVVVDVTTQTQLQRALTRDKHSSSDAIRNIMASQVSREVRLQAAHDVINNEGSKEDTLRQVQALHKTYLNFEIQAL